MFYAIAEEGAESKPKLDEPDEEDGNCDDPYAITCPICYCTVYDPVYCNKCYAVCCLACRKINDKNDNKSCFNCI